MRLLLLLFALLAVVHSTPMSKQRMREMMRQVRERLQKESQACIERQKTDGFGTYCNYGYSAQSPPFNPPYNYQGFNGQPYHSPNNIFVKKPYYEVN